MKIIYLVNQRLPTEKAYGIQITKMCEALSLAGAEVQLIVPTRRSQIDRGIFDYYDIKKNFAIKGISSPDFYWPGQLDKLAVSLKSFLSATLLVLHIVFNKVDAIYSRDELPIYLLSFFKSNIFFEAHKFSKKKSFFYRRFKKSGIKVIVISSGLREEFLKFGLDDKKVLVAPDAVDLEQFNIALSPEECRIKLGLSTHSKIVGYVGQLSTMGMEKGVGALIEAMGSLRPGYPDLQLAVVGGSVVDIDKYQSLVNKQGLNDMVLFLGHKDHSLVPYYLKSFDILAMPYPDIPHYSQFMSPLKLFEYMASGKPIVASDLPSLREVLNNSNSVLIEPNNVNALAKGVKSLLDDPGHCDALSKKVAEDIKNYTWERRASLLLKFIL